MPYSSISENDNTGENDYSSIGQPNSNVVRHSVRERNLNSVRSRRVIESDNSSDSDEDIDSRNTSYARRRERNFQKHLKNKRRRIEKSHRVSSITRSPSFFQYSLRRSLRRIASFSLYTAIGAAISTAIWKIFN